MNIKFKHICIENFLSLGHVEIDLDSRGYVLVSGINKSVCDSASSNGSGKSSIWEALVYGLTGDTIRGISKVSNVNASDGALVDLSFDADGHPFRILRSKDHSKWKTSVHLWVDGEEKSGKGIRETDKLISEFLPELSSQIVGSVIVLGQGLPQRFTNNTPAGRKEVLEKLTKSDYMIEDLKARIASRRNDLTNELNALDIDSASKQGQLHATEEQITSLKSSLASVSNIDTLREHLSAEESQLEDLCHKCDELDNNIRDWEKAVSDYREEYSVKSVQLKLKLSEIENAFLQSRPTEKIAELNQRKRQLENECAKIKALGDVCPTCGQAVSEEYKGNIFSYEAELEDIGIQLEQLNDSEAVLFAEKEQAMKEARESFNRAVTQLTENANALKSRIERRKASLQKCTLIRDASQARVVSLKQEIANTSSSLQNIEDSIKTLEQKRESLNAQVLYNEAESHIRSERLGVLSKFNSAVTREFRGYLLSGIVDFINSTAKHYAKTAFGNDNISFELDKNNISVRFNNKDYESLSGGEKQKIDIIVQLALRNVLCHLRRFSVNIIVLDEIFDNLDAVGCQQVIDLMTAELKDVSSVFIVTHHASDLSIPYDDEITVVKNEAGVSEI